MGTQSATMTREPAKHAKQPSKDVARIPAVSAERKLVAGTAAPASLGAIPLLAPGERRREPSVPSIVHEELRSPGEPLDAATLRSMEPRFGNLGHVRLHTGPQAAASAKAVDAAAYTHQNDVVFGAGKYRPNTPEGQNLLAHELTHVAQQGNAQIPLRGVAPLEDPAEREARVPGGGARATATPGLLYRQANTNPTPQSTPTALPLDVSLTAQVLVFEANDQWVPSGTPKLTQQFNPSKLPGGQLFIPPVKVPIDFGHRAIFEIVASTGTTSQSFFWRCDATSAPGISRLDPLGAQPGAVPTAPRTPSATTTVLSALTGTQSNTATTATLQAFGQISATSTSAQTQVQGGVTVGPLGGQVARAYQKNAPTPQYNITLTADVALSGAPPAPSGPTVDLPPYYVNFANDSSVITSAETTRLLTWVHDTVGGYTHLREAIRSGLVPVLVTGRASVRGNAAHNFQLSQRRVEAVRLALEGAASASGGGRTQGGALGSEFVKIDAEADGDFHNPKPENIDQDRVVEIFIDGTAASAAILRLSNPPSPTGGP